MLRRSWALGPSGALKSWPASRRMFVGAIPGPSGPSRTMQKAWPPERASEPSGHADHCEPSRLSSATLIGALCAAQGKLHAASSPWPAGANGCHAGPAGCHAEQSVGHRMTPLRVGATKHHCQTHDALQTWSAPRRRPTLQERLQVPRQVGRSGAPWWSPILHRRSLGFDTRAHGSLY